MLLWDRRLGTTSIVTVHEDTHVMAEWERQHYIAPWRPPSDIAGRKKQVYGAQEEQTGPSWMGAYESEDHTVLEFDEESLEEGELHNGNELHKGAAW
ncbi:hypothetical protein NDU88_010624 [Pleurodeles waltl]|uniref:Uncharacterized protein n=1 Tax=Pleurodeles waltl TaxID=8319 RepID=A0AAV7S1S9_PLEWA|nr:hypothetical protein NDU88_010624 [Pleurodeles waltl]